MFKRSSAFKMIPVNSILIGKYQRNYSQIYARAKKMAQNYDKNLIGAIKVSLRNGTYWVIDGQHRLVATQVVGENVIMCEIFDGLTYEQEASMFLALDEGVKGLTPNQKMNARIESGEEKAIKINDVVNKNRYSLALTCSYSHGNKIRSIGTVEKIVDNYGFDVLDATLKLISLVWPKNSDSLQGWVLYGVATFVKNNTFNEEVFMHKLSKVAPSVILREAASNVSCPYEEAMQMTIKKYYNNNNRNKI